MPIPLIFRRLLGPLAPRRLRQMREKLQILDLMEQNPMMGSPTAAKQGLIRQAAASSRCEIFVETGSYRGDMAAWASRWFPRVHTIELQPALAAAARLRFTDEEKVTVHEGDSAQQLARLLPALTAPTLFWLDAHYSGGETARGAEDTPLLRELAEIRRHAAAGSVILIDDARLMGTDPAYPPLEAVITALRGIDPEFHIGVATDILWAAPQPVLVFEWKKGTSGAEEIGIRQ